MATKYEKTRVLSARTLQIAQGAPSLVNPTAKNSQDIAREELEKNKIPLVVV